MKSSSRSPKRRPNAIAKGAPTKKAAGGYDETTAARIRAALAERADVVEKRMFGGLCFMVNGQMCCGLTKTDFMVRVGRDAYEEALAQPHARPMDFTGRPLAGMVYVAPAGYKTKAALAKWLGRGIAFVTAHAPDRSRGNASQASPRPRR
jgi:hypothetical protein